MSRRRTARPGPGLFAFLALVAALVVVVGCTAGRRAPAAPPGADTGAVVPAPESALEPAADDEAATPAEDVAGADAGTGDDALETPPAEFDDADADVLTEDLSESPTDELAVTPEITPEAAARERDLAEQQKVAFDIPMELNEKVLGWLEHYSNRNRDKFRPGLVRSGRYLPMIRKIFEDEGIPRDLAYMAHVESAFKVNAYSRAHAKGLFQFISGTGRRYGLRIDWWVDERSDPEKAARAAAAYLKDLYGEFDDWYLALAAYNAGEGRVRRAIARTGSRDFWTIARTRQLRPETRNYVPAILAATLIHKDPEKYGFDFDADDPIAYDTIEVEGAADLRVLARCAGTDFETMKVLNPALRRLQTPPHATTTVRVPTGAAESTLAALEEIPTNRRVLYARHRVRRGDTLSTIARRYGVSVRSIQAANRMGRRTMIREGRVLVIPTIAASDFGVPAAAVVAEDMPAVYRVRRGDTLYAIARRYGTTPRAIAAANGIPVNGVLSIGQRLRLAPAAAADGASTRSYVVRRGDTLSRIARRHGTSVAALCRANRISSRTTLYPGTRLEIPTN